MLRIVDGRLFGNGYNGKMLSRLVERSLRLFIENQGEIISRDDYAMGVWGEDEMYVHGADDHRIDKMVQRTREYTGKGAIKALTGRGFIFTNPDREGDLSDKEYELLTLFGKMTPIEQESLLASLRS